MSATPNPDRFFMRPETSFGERPSGPPAIVRSSLEALPAVRGPKLISASFPCQSCGALVEVVGLLDAEGVLKRSGFPCPECPKTYTIEARINVPEPTP